LDEAIETDSTQPELLEERMDRIHAGAERCRTP
jgi:hypothetical protein